MDLYPRADKYNHAAVWGLRNGATRTGRTAASALRNGGRLMLVANRGMTYEPVLGTEFKESGETCRNARFKILWAKK